MSTKKMPKDGMVIALKEGDYLLVSVEGHKGYVQIKAEHEGVVVDIWNDKDELVTTNAAWYEDMETEE